MFANKATIAQKRNRMTIRYDNAVFKDNLQFFIMLTPAILYFIIFHYTPMLGIIIAFKHYRYDLGILGSPWAAFDNFRFFFASQDAWIITRNTVSYGAVFIVVNIMTGVLVAVLLFEISKRVYVKFYQTVMILPHFMSWIVVGYIVYALLDPVYGVANNVMRTLGLETINWYANPVYWPFILVVTNTWKAVGMGSIIYYAALMGIDPSLFEAAVIDGANKRQQIWHITIPMLVPLMTIQSILAIGNIFRGDFGLFYQIPMDVGALYPVTDIIDTYVYRGLRNGNISVTTAVGLFQSVVGLFLVVVTNRIVTRINPDNALF